MTACPESNRFLINGLGVSLREELGQTLGVSCGLYKVVTLDFVFPTWSSSCEIMWSSRLFFLLSKYKRRFLNIYVFSPNML